MATATATKTYTVSYIIQTTSGERLGEFYGFKTKGAAKGYVTRVFNQSHGAGNWWVTRMAFYFE